jgi:hypothetical protein
VHCLELVRSTRKAEEGDKSHTDTGELQSK